MQVLLAVHGLRRVTRDGPVALQQAEISAILLDAFPRALGGKIGDEKKGLFGRLTARLER